jgi:hypothetical protein
VRRQRVERQAALAAQVADAPGDPVGEAGAGLFLDDGSIIQDAGWAVKRALAVEASHWRPHPDRL